MTKPIVAIVGRPNVGKSTLFNRIIGERLAITEDLPGTTRDRIYGDASWGGHEFTLVDTGGLELSPGSDLIQKVKEQVEVAIAEADVIIFLVDVLNGVTVPDADIAQALRRSGKPVVLAVNKADNEQRRQEALQFYEMGIGDPVPLSAYHATGTYELMDRVIALLPPPSPATAEEGVMKVAIVGRPNVGKSLLLNAILGEERAIVNEAPGTTRDALDTPFRYRDQPVLLIDTAGIRRRGRVERGVEHYSVLRALRAIDRADVALLVAEATEPMTAQDLHVAGYIQQAFKGIVLVINKWDLVQKKEKAPYIQQARQQLRFMPHAPIVFTSALLGEGTEEVLAAAWMVYQERLKRIPTAPLNKVVRDALVSHAPPMVRGSRLNILYATQTGVNPPTFVFFVNNPALVHFSYRRYLENKLRQAFGFDGSPLRLIFKGRERD